MMKVGLVIPTYNAGRKWEKCLESIQRQNLELEVLVIDSSSEDDTVSLTTNYGYVTHIIKKSEFNHGGTRNLAVSLLSKDVEIVVFMTQDAILASDGAIKKLLESFNDNWVSIAYGRQLPHKNANPIASHARLFNYPNKSRIKSLNDITDLGIKTAFSSNSFAAYRISVFKKLGAFPQDIILAEDMYLTARIILAGYKVVYCAEAQVYHSHNYSLKEEFQRNFDVGVFQANEKWIQENFGSAGSEGRKYVYSEFLYLAKYAKLWMPKSFLSILCKYSGYKLGLNWKKIPHRVRKLCTMHNNFWT